MATDRLRRKLRDVDPDDLSTLTENFCTIGTPLPSLTSHKKDQNELKPIWQQEARDAQGKRRFHGAFTGGWSAGYFNTVGSKEGWTPGSFRSSRKDKLDGKGKEKEGGEGVGSRPEDFMDEEDLEDWKAAQQVSTSSVGGLNQIAGLRGADDPLTSALLGSVGVGVANDDDLGYRLMRRMGWKPGQGLGPKVNATKKARLVSLISTSGATASSSSVKLEDDGQLYYPPLTPPLTAQTGQLGRTSRKGLGAQDKPTLAQTLAKNYKETAPPEADVWPDGRPLLPGFRLARQAPPPEPVFEQEPVPEGWQPDPGRVFQLRAPLSDDQKKKMTPTARGQLLGEAKIPGPPPNIAAFLSAKARERLAAESNAALPSSASLLPRYLPEYVDVPRLDVVTAKQALQGFAPFGADAAKQERYLRYLQGQSEPDSEQASRLKVPEELTAEQYSNELKEFAKSASIFRPMSSAIASRFTTASAAVMEHETRATTATPGLRHPAPASSSTAQANDSTIVEPEKQLSTAQQAAKMGNFGHLTRKVEPWAPERLLCKRFGVPEPLISRKAKSEQQPSSTTTRPDIEDDPDPFYGSTQSSKHKSTVRADQHWERNKHQLQALASAPTPLSLDASRSTAHTLPIFETEEIIGMANDPRQGSDTLTYVKPSLDVYRAIFASDEESGGEGKAKIQDSSASAGDGGGGVVFRPKRKDVDAAQKDGKKMKKEKKKKSLLTFDFDDGDDGEVEEEVPRSTVKGKVKERMRASDLF